MEIHVARGHTSELGHLENGVFVQDRVEQIDDLGEICKHNVGTRQELAQAAQAMLAWSDTHTDDEFRQLAERCHRLYHLKSAD